MQRFLAILVLGFLALASVGLPTSAAGAGPANCAPSGVLDDANVLASLVTPAAQVEGPAAKNRSTPVEGPQYACNSGCARACSQRFGNCPTRQCRQQYNSCVRSCGC